MLKITMEMNFDELYSNCWSGAIDTLKTIIENNKKEELMELLEEMFSESASMTKVNDFLWFDDEYIYECLGIEEEDMED